MSGFSKGCAPFLRIFSISWKSGIIYILYKLINRSSNKSAFKISYKAFLTSILNKDNEEFVPCIFFNFLFESSDIFL